MFSKTPLRTCLLAGLSCLLSTPLLAKSYTYISLVAPNAQQTLVTGLNNAGVVVGNWVDQARVTHGYVWQNSQFSTIDPPGSVTTVASGINDAGVVVGTYRTADNVLHGFFFSAGTYTKVDAPGGGATSLVSINNSSIASGSSGGADFLYSAGTFTTYTSKGSPTPVAMNNASTVVGTYDAHNGDQLGYLYLGGKLSSIAIPNTTLVNPGGVNNANVVAGNYYDTTTAAVRGFTYARHKVTIIDAPGTPQETFVYNINDAGLIIGNSWTDSPLNATGFVLANGTFTKIQPPAGTSVFPSYINTAGEIAGSYSGPAGNEVFLATPAAK